MPALTIDLSSPDLSFQSGHLRLGGADPRGVAIDANSRYLTLGGQPWLPVMGEFHFSRYPWTEWRAELLKMKTGGIQVAATYIFWNHHEEIEGRYDWSGNRDLRAFVTLCADLGLYSYPRLGPWAHGEARLGGFPDWLVARCPVTRQDDPAYLDEVRRWYGQIAGQLAGLLWKDGGPVVGVQLENELYDQPDHIVTLKRLAREVGIDVPLYTMTGWGPAQVPPVEVLPVFGGYPDAPWDRQVEGWARTSRKHYFFSAIRDDNVIGADLRLAAALPDASRPERGSTWGDWPYGTCELGGGSQVTYHRRPCIDPRDVSAMALVKLGSGANLLGYYMYHGGTQPLGERSTLQESQETGYWNDLPERSYDFQAPLGESGQVREHYHRLRAYHLFLADFGADLAPLPPVFPAIYPAGLDDRQTLRWAARSDGRRGYVFINNYQRSEPLPDHAGVQLELQLKDERLIFPSQPVRLPAGLEAIWPFHFNLGGVDLRWATAQPVCCLADGVLPVYIFAATEGVPAEFAFGAGVELARWQRAPAEAVCEAPNGDGCYVLSPGSEHAYTLLDKGLPAAHFFLLTPVEALGCYRATYQGRERIFLSQAALLFDGERLELRAGGVEHLGFAVYPPLDPDPGDARAVQSEVAGPFTRFLFCCPAKTVTLAARQVREAGPARVVPLGQAGVAQAPGNADFAAAEVWQVDLPADLFAPETSGEIAEVRLVVDYSGDAARATLGDELVADDFSNGRPWEIGLRRLVPAGLARGLSLLFLPLRRDAPIYLPGDWRARMGERESVLEVRAVVAEVEYRVEVL